MDTKRINESLIFQAFENDFITLLIGPRRVGKTSLVQKYLQSAEKKLSVSLNLDEMEIRAQIEAGRLELVLENRFGRRLSELDSRLIVVIDEAQKCPELFDQVKILYDRFKVSQSKIKFVLTGSGSLSLYSHSAESLAGRIFVYHLNPFSLGEALHLTQGIEPAATPFSTLLFNSNKSDLPEQILALQPQKKNLQEALSEQLIWGGFPEVLSLRDEIARKVYLANYRQTYLEKDIRALDQVGDLKSFNLLLEIIAMQISTPRQDKRLYDALGISPQTLKKYLSILESTFLYHELTPYIFSPLRRLVKAAKGYLCDNGLMSYLRGVYDMQALQGTGAIGVWFENWVLTNLRGLFSQHPIPPQFFYWRTSGGQEVDIIIRHEASLIPIEVKFAQKVSFQMTKSLRTFLAEEKQAQFGIVIYNGEYIYDEQSRIHYFPAWALL